MPELRLQNVSLLVLLTYIGVFAARNNIDISKRDISVIQYAFYAHAVIYQIILAVNDIQPVIEYKRRTFSGVHIIKKRVCRG